MLMLGMIIRRVLGGLLTLLIVSIVVFVGTNILPGDATEAILGQSTSPEAVAGLRKALGLDLPAHERYLQWLFGLLLLAFGGVPYVLWGIFFRTTAGLHATWLVNSATHKWGSRRYATTDDSTNNWWVALLTFGEGWHNNHHAFPTSARHGLAWYELDPNWIGIRTMQWLGLAWDVKVPEGRKARSSGLPILRPSD